MGERFFWVSCLRDGVAESSWAHGYKAYWSKCFQDTVLEQTIKISILNFTERDSGRF